MEEKLISVILPVYNVEPYLERAVKSLCLQTWSRLDIILVDDGSTDSSPQLCDRLAEQDCRIHVIHKPNGGVSSARNAGLDAASGDYIAFVDPDDYIAPEMMETLAYALEKNDADLSVCNYQCVGELTEEFAHFNESLPFRNEVFSGRDEIEQRVLESQEWYWVVLWNKLYRRSLLDGLRFQTGKICEDEFMLHEYITRCSRIACVAQPLYYYERRGGSITHITFRVQRLDGAEALFRRAAALLQMGYSHESIYLAVITGISFMNCIYDYGHGNDPVFRTRYLQLLGQFRSLGLRQLMVCCDTLPRKAKLLLAFISPHLLWKLKNLLH